MKFKYTVTFTLEEDITLENLRDRCSLDEDEIDEDNADEHAHDFMVDNWEEMLSGEMPDVEIKRVKE